MWIEASRVDHDRLGRNRGWHRDDVDFGLVGHDREPSLGLGLGDQLPVIAEHHLWAVAGFEGNAGGVLHVRQTLADTRVP